MTAHNGTNLFIQALVLHEHVIHMLKSLDRLPILAQDFKTLMHGANFASNFLIVEPLTQCNCCLRTVHYKKLSVRHTLAYHGEHVLVTNTYLCEIAVDWQLYTVPLTSRYCC